MAHVEQVNPQLEPILRRWWEVGRASWAPDRVAEDWPSWEVGRRLLPAHNPERESSLYLAYDGDDVVGFAMVILPVRDNLHLAFVDLGVLPEHRRRGHGTSIVHDLEQRVRDRGRTTVVVEGYAPPEGSAPCEPFAAATGYDVASEETVKRQELATYRTLRPGLVAEVGTVEGYTIVGWDTECPDDLVEGCCAIVSGFFDEVPTGELALEDSEWTPQRWRAWEARNRDIGRHSLVVAAVTPDGSVAGMSDIRVDDADPAQGSVGITLVTPEHRGRQLGLALKVAATDLALEHFPDLVHVETWNSDRNTHMNRVNERVGFVPVERCLELQKLV